MSDTHPQTEERAETPVVQHGLRIGLFGHFGSLNAGNESTLDAILDRLRELAPDAEFLCACTDPEAVRARGGIDAISIVPEIPQDELKRFLDTRGGRAYTRVRTQVRQYRHAFRALEGADALIIPGTGLLTDAFGLGGWGPAGLFRWVLMAKARGARVMFVSVGAGPLYSRRGRLLAIMSLLLADYRSYRDDASREYLGRIGFRPRHDRVYPDLVFASSPTLLPETRAPEGSRRVVGLGLMQYAGRYSARAPVPETQADYLRALEEFGAWLVTQGYEVQLMIGDGDGDPGVLETFEATLRARVGADLADRISATTLTSTEDVLDAIATTDVVVATRFHNLVFSLLLNKPVIAIAFHHKCTSLMDAMGLSEYCQEIHAIDPEQLTEQFRSLEANRGEIKALIDQRVRRERLALDEQYERLLESMRGARVAAHA